MSYGKISGEWEHIAGMAMIADGLVNMARLAIVGSYSVNGVAKLHSEILSKILCIDFHNYYPYKFNNKTNGITHRRWLLKANPRLATLITNTIGGNWVKYPAELLGLSSLPQIASFKGTTCGNKIAKQTNDWQATLIKIRYNRESHSIFDVQIKRIHAYKRQILNALHIMHLYNQLKENPNYDIIPRTFIFAGKAAPSYYIAKQIVKLINLLAEVINNDKSIKDKLKVVFLENYSVSLGEIIFRSRCQ